MNKRRLSWPFYSKEEIKLVQNILEAGNVNYWTGNECKKFEKEFAKYIGTNYAISLSNGTVALDLAFEALGLKEGDEIIVTSRTFIASVSSIIRSGARPVFADISLNSQNIYKTSIEPLITSKTVGILCVHLAGWPCDMKEINKIAKENKLYVIEDCAQSHGAIYKGKKTGSLGTIACWSFCQDKIMSTGGEGGMITTNNKRLWNKIWALKDHGKSITKMKKKSASYKFKWVHDSFGTNNRMTEIQGGIGRIQLKNLEKSNYKRNEYQTLIWDCCKSIEALRVPDFKCADCSGCSFKNGCRHGAYKCYVFIEPSRLKKGWNRDRVVKEINALDVFCSSGSCSEVYLEKAFSDTTLVPKKRLKNAEELGRTSLMFLIHPTLTKKEIAKTCKAIKNVMTRAAI